MSEHHAAIVVGAGSGVGKAAGILLAEVGYDLLLVGRTPAKLEQTRRQITGGGEIAALGGDICQPEFCREVIETCLARFGRIDALANIAGYASLGPAAAITPEAWRLTIDSNLSYVMYLTAAAWPTFQRQKSGVIVNVSSLASIDPFPGFALYAPAKAALNMFTRIVGDEGREIGLQAVCLAPGAIETPMLRALFDEKDLPKNKTLDPLAVAAVIRDCITGIRRFTSGETIPLPSP